MTVSNNDCIADYLRTYVPLPETHQVFLAGKVPAYLTYLRPHVYISKVRDTSRYEATFANLEIERALDKVVVLRDGNSQALDASSFQVATLSVDGLFMKPESVSQTSPYYNSTGLISPVSPARAPVGHLIDPALVSVLSMYYLRTSLLTLQVLQPLHKRMSLIYSKGVYNLRSIENPPPCNEHYLMVCSKGVRISLLRCLRT